MEHLELVLTRDRHPLCSFLTGLPQSATEALTAYHRMRGAQKWRTNDDLDQNPTSEITSSVEAAERWAHEASCSLLMLS